MKGSRRQEVNPHIIGVGHRFTNMGVPRATTT